MALDKLNGIPSWVRTNRAGALLCNMHKHAISDVVNRLVITGTIITKCQLDTLEIAARIDKAISDVIIEQAPSKETSVSACALVKYFGVPMLVKERHPYAGYSAIIREIIIGMMNGELIVPYSYHGSAFLNRLFFAEVRFVDISPMRGDSNARIDKLMTMVKRLPKHLLPELYAIIDSRVLNTYTPVKSRETPIKGLALKWDELLK